MKREDGKVLSYYVSAYQVVNGVYVWQGFLAAPTKKKLLNKMLEHKEYKYKKRDCVIITKTHPRHKREEYEQEHVGLSTIIPCQELYD